MTSTRLPGPERREQLLDVARHVLAQRGFHETSMNDIADAAGVTKPVLYQHFASKRELHQAVLEDVGQRLESVVIDSAVRAASPREQVQAGFTAYVGFVEEDFDGFSLLFSRHGQEDSDWTDVTSRVEGSIANRVAPLINVSGMSDEQRLALAHGVVGMAEGMVRHWRSHTSPVSAQELIRDLTALAWVGLRGMEPNEA